MENIGVVEKIILKLTLKKHECDGVDSTA